MPATTPEITLPEVTPNGLSQERFASTLDRLIRMSQEDEYDPFKEFDWPASIPEDRLWMSEDLLTVHGTEVMDELTPEQLIRLSKWECINFFSLNVSGIRELLLEVIHRVHSPGFEVSSEYLHYFVGEENEHMWYFARFCLDYGGKLYKDRRIQFGKFDQPDIQHFMVFVTVLIFEEIVDFFNSRMGRDESLHPTLQGINRLHHLDETRHITFGRQNVELLHAALRRSHDEETLAEIESVLKRYMVMSIQKLYNPEVYKDAGLPDAHKLRNRLMRHPARKEFHGKVLGKTAQFFTRKGIFQTEDLPL